MTHWQIARAFIFGSGALAFWIACATAGNALAIYLYGKG